MRSASRKSFLRRVSSRSSKRLWISRSVSGALHVGTVGGVPCSAGLPSKSSQEPNESPEGGLGAAFAWRLPTGGALRGGGAEGATTAVAAAAEVLAGGPCCDNAATGSSHGAAGLLLKSPQEPSESPEGGRGAVVAYSMPTGGALRGGGLVGARTSPAAAAEALAGGP